MNRKENKVVVQGINMKFKIVTDEENQRVKKTVQKEHPIHVSNVMLVDPQINKPTKIRYGFLEDGTKVRVSKKSGAIIPKPDREHLTYFNRTKSRETGENDTAPDVALQKTYKGEDFSKVKAEFEEYIRMKQEKEELLVFKK